jgi:hypothetical protein
LKSKLLVFLVVLCFSATLVLSQSQATSGQINGRVTDSSGAVLPGASVKISSAETGFTRAVLTNDEGLYVAPLLPPGNYELSAELTGFQTARATGIRVTVGSSIPVNLTMQVSGATESVIVTAKTPVEITSSASSTTLTNLEDLPINGRRFQNFVTLTPTAQVDTQRGQISLAGQRGINANISVDGADYNQPFFGGIRGGERSNSAFTIPQESIREFQVVAAGYSAEFGRSTGGVVNAVTKSGTNAFHGSGYYAIRHKNWTRNNDFFDAISENLKRPIHPTPTQQQFGGSLGGPVKKDKAFFFGAYEQQRVRFPREVLFDNLTTFTPTADVKEVFDYYKSLETHYTQTNDARVFLGRFDYQLSDANRFNARYSQGTNTAENGVSVGNAILPTVLSALSNNGTEKDRTYTLVGQLTSIASATVINEMRAQYSREVRPRLNNARQPTVTNAIGTFGTVNFLPTTQFDWRVQFANNLSLISGGHSFKFGVEYNHAFADQTFAFNQFGSFLFSITNTAQLLDLLSVGGTTPNRFDSTQVTYLRQIGNGRLALTVKEGALFAQDSWRIRPNFTLNYGLRWEGQFNPTPEANNQAIVNRVRGVVFPSGHQLDPTFIPDSPSQFGPRLGFAWDPLNDTKTVIRGFAGVYYAKTPMLLLAGPLNNYRVPPGDISIQLPLAAPGNPNNTVYKQLLLIGIDLNKFPLGNLPILSAEQVQSVAQALGQAFDPFIGVQPISIAGDLKNPQSFQSGIGFERQLWKDFSMGAEYVQVNTIHLQRNRDLNLPVPRIRANDPAQRPFYGLLSGTPRPVGTLGSIQVRESTAHSRYQAFTIRAQMRRGWGQFGAFYTLSRSLSDDDNERDAGGVSFENAYDQRPEYNYARLDRRHQVVANPVFYFPWGFEVSSGIRLRSGIPIDVRTGADSNEDRGGADRPFSAAGKPFKRNAFRNFAVKDVDLRVQKSFTFAEERKLILSSEFYNVRNYENIQLSGTAVTNYCASPIPLDCGFGRPTNINFLETIDRNPVSPRFGKRLLNNNPGDPFQVQLAVRFQF